MRKAILMMVLAVVGNSAVAEWAPVGSTETATAYADLKPDMKYKGPL